jgi:hypothetical protein
MVVDYFTKWEEVMPIIKYDGKTTTFFMFTQIIAHFGIPKYIFIDHDSHFHNEIMMELASKMGFTHGHSSLIIPRKMDK